MTAQRTTLLSMCLLLIVLSNNPPEDHQIGLLTTNIRVQYEYALKLLVALIILNGASYLWRHYAEYEGIDVGELDSLVVQASHKAQQVEQNYVKAFGDKEGEGDRLKLFQRQPNVQVFVASSIELRRAAQALSKSVRNKIIVRAKFGNIRDRLFDFIIPLIFIVFSVNDGVAAINIGL